MVALSGNLIDGNGGDTNKFGEKRLCSGHDWNRKVRW